MGRRLIDDNILLEMVKQGKMQKEIAAHLGVSPVAICKRLKRLVPPPNLDHLTPKRKEFVVRVSQGLAPTSAAMEAFDCKDRKSGKVLGSQLMGEPAINEGIKQVMDYWGLTRSHRVQRLKGHVDHPDPNVSLKALDQSWRLDGYVEKHLNVHMTSDDYRAVSKNIEYLERRRVALLRVIEKDRAGMDPEEIAAAKGELEERIQAELVAMEKEGNEPG